MTPEMPADEIKRINPFDWDTEFADTIKAGGFDAVIGNPPYIRIQTMKEWAPTEVEFYKKKFISASKGNYDIYVVFVEQGLSLLNKNGLLGYILPHKFFNAQYGEPLRSVIAKGKHLKEIVHFGHQQVFDNATTYTCLLFLGKRETDQIFMAKVDSLLSWHSLGEANSGIIFSKDVSDSEWNFVVGSASNIYHKLNAFPTKLKDISNIFVGLQTSADTVFLFKNSKKASDLHTTLQSNELDKTVELESILLKPVIRSGDIGRYWANATSTVLFPYRLNHGHSDLIPDSELKRDYPNIWVYLNENKKLLSEREHGKFKDTGWYQLYPKNLDLWECPEIMVPYMVSRLAAYYDEENYYFVNVTTGGFGITLKTPDISLKYLTGLLNSHVLNWFLKSVSTTFRGGYFAANKQFLDQLPIRTINFADPADKARHDRMVTLVTQMLDLNKKVQDARLEQEKTLLSRQIEATDAAIDTLVYELYGLTEEEIAIVEGNAK